MTPGDRMTDTQRHLDARAAVDKALSLLSAFRADARTGLGVSELARRANLSKSTAHRILALLERNGAVEREGVSYRLGGMITELGKLVETPQHGALRDTLTPHLADLYEITRQTVHLAALEGSDVVYLNKLQGHRTIATPARIGGTAPAYCTAEGKALLAFDSTAFDAAMSRKLIRWTSNTTSSAEEFERELNEVRRDRIAYDRGEYSAGLQCVSVPVMAAPDRPLAAFSVSFPAGIDPSAFAPDLRRVAFSASRTLLTARISGHGTRTPVVTPVAIR
jgi:IclR family KDG regulon transcriptional repressor